jgi:hypothetical protein
VRDQHILQAGRRIRNAVATDTPFVERMVHFWANHFAISVDKMELVGLGGLMEFEAIRPHVLGRFEDMLIAVEQHPAMLLYLDQAQSVGPDSTVGTRANRNGRKAVGLNENLAREIMELHTLGVRSGYTQADVTEFARAMTGWTVTGIGRGGLPKPLTDPLPVGSFVLPPHCTSRANATFWASATIRRVKHRPAPFWPTSHAVPPQPVTSPPSWPGMSWLMIRRPRSSTGWPRPITAARATCPRSIAR